MQSDRPIFIIGCPRSGTTLLQLMLHSHSRIAVPPETRFLQSAYGRRKDFGDLRITGNREKLAEWIVNDKRTKFGDLKIDPALMVKEIVAAPPTLGSAIGTVFRVYAQQYGKARWGDKRPTYYRRVGMLRRLFPDAQFIHLIRDGRDCAASLKEMPWYKLDLYHAMAGWAHAVDLGRRYARTLPHDSYYELRYEDLTADPGEELQKLCAFLRERYEPSMCEPRHVAGEAVPTRKVWHERTHEAVNTDRVRSWEKRLEPAEIALAEHVLGSRLEEHGYELTGAPRPPVKQIAFYERIVAKRRLRMMRWKSADRIGTLREPGPVGALITSGQRKVAGLSQEWEHEGLEPGSIRLP